MSIAAKMKAAAKAKKPGLSNPAAPNSVSLTNTIPYGYGKPAGTETHRYGGAGSGGFTTGTPVGGPTGNYNRNTGPAKPGSPNSITLSNTVASGAKMLAKRRR